MNANRSCEEPLRWKYATDGAPEGFAEWLRSADTDLPSPERMLGVLARLVQRLRASGFAATP